MMPSPQQAKLIQVMAAAGYKGAHMRELNAVCFRYGGRLQELRRKGFVIDTVQLGVGEFKYRLVSIPITLEWRDNLGPAPAMDRLMELI